MAAAGFPQRLPCSPEYERADSSPVPSPTAPSSPRSVCALAGSACVVPYVVEDHDSSELEGVEEMVCKAMLLVTHPCSPQVAVRVHEEADAELRPVQVEGTRGLESQVSPAHWDSCRSVV